MLSVSDVITENERRRALLDQRYCPELGVGCSGERVRCSVEWEQAAVWLPRTMVDDARFARMKSLTDYMRLRFLHDFEFWCVKCVNIRHKRSGRIGPMILNAPQRRVLASLEADRLAGRPIRIILLKARQWGGSTLIQVYMAWIQSVHRRNWHSLITAHIRNTAATLRKLYSDTMANYPEDLWEGDERPRFRPVPDAPNSRIIAGRGCVVTISSSFSPDSVRGIDLSMAHLSEVAFWKDSDMFNPSDMLRSICGTVPLEPLSLIVLESTANGVGNFFHAEWLRSLSGESAFRPVFVPWYEIEMYRCEVPDKESFVASMNAREKEMWDLGLTLEMIAWYRAKLSELGELSLMQAEYPTDALEAFVSSTNDVFGSASIEALRPGCQATPAVGEVQGRAVIGEEAIEDVKFVTDPAGSLKVWAMPDSNPLPDRYVVSVDIGGRCTGSDFSVIAVIDRTPPGGGGPEIAAQWRGHCDHDILGWKAAAIASWYGTALLVIESNSLDASSAGSSALILEELNAVYPNLYSRTVRDNTSGRETISHRVGFHTNRRTKALIITMLIAMVRERAYTERDPDALSEMAVYQQLPSGNYAAKRGFHDDILMTRAIGLYVASTLPPPRAFDYERLLRMPRW